MANQNNVYKFRKKTGNSFGIIFFVVIFFYMLICVYFYFTTEHISRYQVKVGSLTESNRYEGLAIREEVIVTSSYNGYINYFMREGERAGYSDLICSIDETGALQEILLEETMDGNSLSEIELSEVRSQIVSFISNSSDESFNRIYDFKYEIEGVILKLETLNVLASLETLNASSENGIINLCDAPQSGIVVYSMDGYEEIDVNSISESQISSENYSKSSLISSELVNTGDAIYKLAVDENWSVVISTTLEQAIKLEEEIYIKVKFLKTQDESWAKVNVISRSEETAIVELQFNNSMITFATDRYLDIELIFEEETGLKVPLTAIENKEFYLVPEEYLLDGESDQFRSVLKQSYNEDGTMTPLRVDVTIYSSDESGNYYVDSLELSRGDILQKESSDETYIIAQSDSLIGIYNINKGYADFKQIEILSENEEYAIIKSNTDYGLRAYDYIVLDADTVNLDDLIF